MKKDLLGLLTAFLFGCGAGYAGLLIAIHHTREPLAQSIHYAWYDWFMYLGWPGYSVASCVFDFTNPANAGWGLLVASITSGLLALLVMVLILGLQKLRNQSPEADPSTSSG